MVEATEFIASFPSPAQLSVTCSTEKFLFICGESLGIQGYIICFLGGCVIACSTGTLFSSCKVYIPTSRGNRALTHSVQQITCISQVNVQ